MCAGQACALVVLAPREHTGGRCVAWRTCVHAVLAPREYTGGKCGAGRTCVHLAPGVFTGG